MKFWTEIGEDANGEPYSQWVEIKKGKIEGSCTCEFGSTWMWTKQNQAEGKICKHLQLAIYLFETQNDKQKE